MSGATLVRRTDDADLDAWVARQLADAPPLSEAQRARLSALLGGGAR